MVKVCSLLLRSGTGVALTLVLLAGSVGAQSGNYGRSAESKARLAVPAEVDRDSIRVAPLRLSGGSTLTLIAPSKWSDLSVKLSESLHDAHNDFTNLFGEIPSFKTSVRLMDEENFYAVTGAPAWTNALYYRGQIIIPLSTDQRLDYQNVKRALVHEFMHAVTNSLSNGKCPGWLDEGLAQWAEGDENPALQPALKSWVSSNGPVPLGLLQGGFTRLVPEMVAPAYAQSLFATTAMINTYGFKEIRKYFDELHDGRTESAFSRAFNIKEADFESRLGKSLRKWVH